MCNNKDCKKKVSPHPGSKTVQCQTCNKSMLLKNCYIEVNASFQLEKDNKQTTVTAFAKTLSSFLDDDVCQYKDSEEALTEKLLLLENVDFYLSTRGRLITSITKHTASDDTSKNQQHNKSQDKIRNSGNFAHKFKASPEHPIWELHKDRLEENRSYY